MMCIALYIPLHAIMYCMHCMRGIYRMHRDIACMTGACIACMAGACIACMAGACIACMAGVCIACMTEIDILHV